jgi:hypothetical protein
MMTSWKAHRLAYSSFAICALGKLGDGENWGTGKLGDGMEWTLLEWTLRLRQGKIETVGVDC